MSQQTISKVSNGTHHIFANRADYSRTAFPNAQKHNSSIYLLFQNPHGNHRPHFLEEAALNKLTVRLYLCLMR